MPYEYRVMNPEEPIELRYIDSSYVDEVRHPTTGWFFNSENPVQIVAYVFSRSGNWQILFQEDGSENVPRRACPGCNQMVIAANLERVIVRNGRTADWCRRCISNHSIECGGICGDRYSSSHNDMPRVDGITYCLACVEENHVYCSGCNAWVGCDENGDDDHCNGECHFDNCDRYQRNNSDGEYYGNSVIRDYSYKPAAVFHPALPRFSWENRRMARDDHSRSRVIDLEGKPLKRSILLQFGIELEVENDYGDNTQEIAREFYEKFNPDVLTLKHDGSLYNGFEIVVQPRSLASWREFAPEFGNALLWLREAGCRAWSNDRCGLHIHASKVAYDGPSHVARFGMLYARNEFGWVKIAHRRASYASFSELRSGGILNKAQGKVGTGHADAVNLNSYGQPTTEIRIWRPSLAGSGRVIAALEFVDASIAFTRLMTVRDVRLGALEWPNFVQYVNEHEYPLAQFVLGGGKFELTKEGFECAS